MTDATIDATDTTIDKMDQPYPLWFILLIPIWIVLFIGVFIFPVAGDWGWLEGWVYVISFAVNFTISYMIINQRNPRVIRNRSKMRKTGLTDDTRESASSDKFIIPLMTITFFAALILPGLGHRFGWYELPFAVALIGAAISNVGVIITNVAQLQNSYASKILDINQGQVLIDTGLYGVVRHPLYTGGILMMVATPIALGSLWGVIPALVAALMIVIRIKFEEEMLVNGMDGYEDYQSRVKYKLIPGIY